MSDTLATPAAAPARTLISIIVPVYNEEDNLDVFHQTITAALLPESARYEFEFIFTDNHSTDRTFEKLERLCEQDDRIRVFRFSRNFGYQKSIYAGYMQARGAAAVQIDVDLEDPPALISEFLRLWEQGYHVVFGIRRRRHEPKTMQLIRKIFYRLVDILSEDDLPHDAGDFRLIDRKIIDQLATISDTNIYIRGRIATMGFRQVGLPYDRDERRFGTSKFNLGSYIRLAIDAITCHSVLPLRLASICGTVMTGLSIVAILGYLIARITFGTEWPRGFTTLAILIIFGIGINSLFLGIIGEYLARIYEQLKLSPHAIIEHRLPRNKPD